MTVNETPGQEKKLQDDLKESAYRIWLAGLGALAAAEQEGSKMFSRLVDRGREVESRGKVDVQETVDRAKAKAGDTWDDLAGKWGDKVDEKLTATLHRLGVPTREEIRALTLKVEELNAKVELLKPRVTPAAGEPTIVTPATEPTDPAKIVV